MRFWGQPRQDEGDERDEQEQQDLGEEGGDLEGESQEEEAEPLEPEMQARVQAEARKLADAEVGQYREAARKRGLDWTGSEFGVVDHTRAAQSFGFANQQQQPVVQQQQETREDDDPEPELDEFTYDAQQVKAWNAWQVRQQTKALQQENLRLRRMQVEDRLDQAMDRVGDAIKRHAPHLEGLMDHPKFGDTFREVLINQQPELWRDTKNLARLAAMVSVDLDPDEMPKRDERTRERGTGRFTAGEERRRQLEQLSPTRGAGTPAGDDLTDDERRAIRSGRLEGAAEARALRSGSFDDYERLFLSKRKGGR